MSQENEQAVRQFTDAFNARDIEALIGQTSPDCVIVARRSEIEGAFVGPDGVRRWAESYLEAAPDVKITVERVSDVDSDRVLVLGRQTGTALVGGAPFDAPLAILAERKEGRLSRFKAFSTHTEALEAAGLSE